jgi:hypothetical protein
VTRQALLNQRAVLLAGRSQEVVEGAEVRALVEQTSEAA